jgi:hypothetical protein
MSAAATTRALRSESWSCEQCDHTHRNSLSPCILSTVSLCHLHTHASTHFLSFANKVVSSGRVRPCGVRVLALNTWVVATPPKKERRKEDIK